MRSTYKTSDIARTGETPKVSDAAMPMGTRSLYNDDGEIRGLAKHFIGRIDPDADFTVAGVSYPGKRSRKSMAQETMKSGGLVGNSRDGCAIRGKTRS